MWRYGIGKKETDGDEYFFIIEVYEDDGVRLSYSGGVKPGGETIEELRQDLLRMYADTFRSTPVVSDL